MASWLMHSSPDRAVRVGGLGSVFGQRTALLNHGVYVICRLGGPYSGYSFHYTNRPQAGKNLIYFFTLSQTKKTHGKKLTQALL